MKKILSIILFLCMIVNIGGYYFISAFYQLGLKSEMKSYLLKNRESSFNTKFTFETSNGLIKDADFAWEEMGDEFMFKGNMYDVVSIDTQQLHITIYCINDHAESKLINLVAAIHQKQDSQSTSAKSAFRKMLYSAFDLNKSIEQTAFSCFLNHFAIVYHGKMKPTDFDVLTPPPDSVLI